MGGARLRGRGARGHGGGEPHGAASRAGAGGPADGGRERLQCSRAFRGRRRGGPVSLRQSSAGRLRRDGAARGICGDRVRAAARDGVGKPNRARCGRQLLVRAETETRGRNFRRGLGRKPDRTGGRGRDRVPRGRAAAAFGGNGDDGRPRRVPHFRPRSRTLLRQDGGHTASGQHRHAPDVFRADAFGGRRAYGGRGSRCRVRRDQYPTGCRAPGPDLGTGDRTGIGDRDAVLRHGPEGRFTRSARRLRFRPACARRL